ncbi:MULTISPECIES: prepilin-type N-terminal cleavage/methylation domain-containing protein [unclassified Dehalobacter]|uniref:type II secretion system protein n=1 Tax=unclassified Dehalobacter TaxID=2635733 RepID=UPI000E6C9BF9|nr:MULTISPECIES: prepilin-type N-terminal cleavage/methylation domain-containing protein [unclassified Dehalobacter]RJE48367.1 prepilin-type N-terminal cleavage/methylation domain-containing protein [Dehalobacter sp. MCB1]TCX50436.1 prepilin-type cleavage/methylation domain-containing protein [Dehalobacter sp. 14DCB1]TCX52324.1 prepilin-type cleavage/methylation domain-containing protein [Dehalobacter sp. 12DCB1]
MAGLTKKTGWQNDKGFTLLEVLVSLVITGIVAAMVLQLYISQYRMAKELMADADLSFAAVRAGQVVTAAVSTAESVVWTGKVLRISYLENGKAVTDSYYLADKDFNGVPDLYREHLGVPNPVASKICEFQCTGVMDGLWQISLTAAQAEKTVYWQRTVRVRNSSD